MLMVTGRLLVMSKIQITLDKGIAQQLQSYEFSHNEKSLFVNACLSLGFDNLQLIRQKMQLLINKKTNNLIGAVTNEIDTGKPMIAIKESQPTVEYSNTLHASDISTPIQNIGANHLENKDVSNETKFIDDDEFGNTS